MSKEVIRAIKIDIKTEARMMSRFEPLKVHTVDREGYAREGQMPSKTVVSEEITYFPRKVHYPLGSKEPLVFLVKEDEEGMLKDLIDIMDQDLHQFGVDKYDTGFSNGRRTGIEIGYNRAAQDYKRHHNQSALVSRIKRAFTKYVLPVDGDKPQ